jgi:hypothetical protein
MENIASPTPVAPVKVITRASECLRMLMEAGLTFDAFQAPIDDPDMRKRLVHFWMSGGYEATTTQKAARTIVDKNFFGIEEAVTHFGVRPTRSQLAALAEVPFTEAELREVKNTHVLVAVFPLSILDIRDCAKTKKLPNSQRFFYDQDWYNKQAFAKDRGDVSWVLVRKTPVENSTSKTWQEQQVLLSDKEETPTARVMIYTIIGHFLATGERLFEEVYVRCSDLDSGGGRVGVGYFVADGVIVYSSWLGHRVDLLGLSASRKFE